MKGRLCDLMIWLGVSCVVVGAAQVHVGLAWAVGGLSLMAYGSWLGSTASKKKGI